MRCSTVLLAAVLLLAGLALVAAGPGAALAWADARLASVDWDALTGAVGRGAEAALLTTGRAVAGAAEWLWRLAASVPWGGLWDGALGFVGRSAAWVWDGLRSGWRAGLDFAAPGEGEGLRGWRMAAYLAGWVLIGLLLARIAVRRLLRWGHGLRLRMAARRT
jgi:hypothetical protein